MQDHLLPASAGEIGVNPSTLYECQKEHAEFSGAVKRGNGQTILTGNALLDGTSEEPIISRPKLGDK